MFSRGGTNEQFSHPPLVVKVALVKSYHFLVSLFVIIADDVTFVCFFLS